MQELYEGAGWVNKDVWVWHSNAENINLQRGELAHICSVISRLTQQILRLLAAFHFSLRFLLFSTAVSNPFTYFGVLSLSLRVCVCVCVFGGISKPRSSGGSHREAVAVMQRWLFINLPPSLLFSPSFLPFSPFVPPPHPPRHSLSLAPDNTQSKPDVQTLPVPTSLPTHYDNAAVFPPHWAPRQLWQVAVSPERLQQTVSINTQWHSCTANCGEKLHAACLFRWGPALSTFHCIRAKREESVHLRVTWLPRYVHHKD